MIGVVSSPSEEPAVREFFELFKTPWEFFRADHAYEVILCSRPPAPAEMVADLVLIYSAEKTAFDDRQNAQVETLAPGTHLPLLGRNVRFQGKASRLQARAAVRSASVLTEAVVSLHRIDERHVVRVGYNLFEEVEALLSEGQPREEADIPALDVHIAFLRNLMTECGIQVVEIPPAPDGYPFAACLTHDLDHASIRRHGFDSTVGGFFYRATIGSVVNLLRGRLDLRGVLTNWGAAFRLPFTQLGFAADFWEGFDRYVNIEGGRPSTFFVIPFENRPGRPAPGVYGAAPSARGSRYDVSHVASKLPAIQAAGCEIGLHGIDAWADSAAGAEEAIRISSFSKNPVHGVRMHWLYRDQGTPAALDGGNFSYDSSAGFNDTVGYRSGTTQVFKALGATRLLELPLHVMDTALFYPDYLNLSMKKAKERLRPLLDHAVDQGGTFTVNWHDRSIAPERLWGGFYQDLIHELSRRKAWFCTGSQAVSWFRKRRSAVFERDGENGVFVRVPESSDAGTLPGLRLRVHRRAAGAEPGFTETAFTTSLRVRIRSDRTTEILQRS